MAQTFEIRFVRSEGLVALFEAPSNSFRWSGNGRLSIDLQGISVGVKRGLLSLLASNRARHIPAANLKEVFREGNALRVEFATAGLPRASLRFWARDRDIAAQIVKLMPTSSTVEIEENPPATSFHVNWRVITLLGTATVALVLCASALREETVSVPPSETMANTGPWQESDARASGETPAAGLLRSGSAHATSRPGADAPAVFAQGQFQPLAFEVRVPRGGIVPLVPGMFSYEAGRREMRLFTEESERAAWWGMTARIQGNAAFHDPGLGPLRDAELAAARAWLDYRQFYPGPGVGDAAAQREFARTLTARVYQYVD